MKDRYLQLLIVKLKQNVKVKKFYFQKKKLKDREQNINSEETKLQY